MLATLTDAGLIRVRPLARPRILWHKKVAEIGRAQRLAIAPDGSTLLIGMGSLAPKLIHLNNKKTLAKLGVQVVNRDPATGRGSIDIYSGHLNSVSGVAYSPDGKKLVTTGTDGTARIWDPKTGKELKKLTHPGSSYGMVRSARVDPLDANRLLGSYIPW